MGLKIKFGGAYESSIFRPVNSYYYHIRAFQFYCEENTIKTVAESGTIFQIYVNKFIVDVYDTAQGDRSAAEGQVPGTFTSDKRIISIIITNLSI